MSALEKSLSEISAKIRAMRNALVPVNRLPVKILQQIPPWLPHAWDIVVASHVCCHWRTAFLSYPDLWTFLGCKAEHATHPFLKMSQLIVTQKDHSGEGSPSPGYGTWKDGNHIIGRRNDRLEKELFGEPSNHPKQRTGTDLEMRGHFPVEATGSGIPGPIATFVDSLLDPLLLENISYARYDIPSPIQRYSIPIVAAGRDLLSHAQVCPSVDLVHSRLFTVERVRPVWVKPPTSSSPSFLLPFPRVPALSQPMPMLHPTLTPARLTQLP